MTGGKRSEDECSPKIKVSRKESALASQVNLVISYTAGAA